MGGDLNSIRDKRKLCSDGIWHDRARPLDGTPPWGHPG